MAIVSKTSTLKFSATVGGDAVGFRQWQATADAQDKTAGSSYTITTTNTSGGTTPPAVTDTLTLNVYKSDGTTLQQSFTLNNTSASQTSTFTPATSGTFIIDIRATKTTGGPTATYDYETDGAPATPPTTFSAVTVDRGYVRSTTAVTQTLSNASLGGAAPSQFQFTDTIYLRSVLTAALNTAASCTNIVRDAGGGTTRRSNATSTTTTFDSTFSGTSTTNGRVNGTGGAGEFPAAATSCETHFTFPNNAITGIAETTVTFTRDTATFDPRVTVLHLLQIDNNVYAAPPMSDPNLSTQRVFPSNGYISTNLRGARGSFSSPNVTGGLNGLTFDITYTANATGQNFGGTGFTTVTEGGEAGWQSTFLIWTAVVGGTWTKTVNITTSDLGQTYLVSPSITYALIATDPNITVNVFNRNGTNKDRHFIAGDTLVVLAEMVNVATEMLVDADSSPAPKAVVRRASGTKTQYLDPADGVWKDAVGVTIPSFPMTLDVANKVWTVTIVSDATWTNDFRVRVIMYKSGSPYFDKDIREITGIRNQHDKYAFDGPGFVGFPTR